MTRYFLEVMYNGVLFHGSQLQGSTPTVQLSINQALNTLFRKEIISFGASRTDQGVHALCNYYHFDTEETLHPDFMYKMNSILPEGISISKMFFANDLGTNARFDAISRSYRYRIYAKKNPFLVKRALYYPFHINFETLNRTAAIIKEYSDFESFSKRNTQSATFRCTISDSHWEQHGEEIHYIVSANRFLRGMVRGLVGTQLQIARGKGTIEGFRKIIEAKDCTQANFSVAGHGLYLEQIVYPVGMLTEIKDYKN